MKKFIIAICGILIVGNAFAAPDRYREPQQITDEAILNSWNLNSNVYGGVLSNSLYPDLGKQIGEDNRNGTRTDEGAIVLWVARDIYEHGANFCQTQIQAANKNGHKYVWLDYHWKNDWPCRRLCEYGWSGSECNVHKLECNPTYSNSTLFRPLKSTDLLTSGEMTNRNTELMNVFKFVNEQDEVTDVTRQTNHILLGVTFAVENGAEVAPIKVIGERHRRNISGLASWIVSANYMNGYNNRLLCQYGYKPNEQGTKCIIAPECSNSPDNNNSTNDDDTASCGTGKDYERYGANTAGICLDCWEKGKNKIYSKIKKQCVNAHAYTKEQMFKNSNVQCWMKTNLSDFAACVLGTTNGSSDDENNISSTNSSYQRTKTNQPSGTNNTTNNTPGSMSGQRTRP